MNSYRWFFVGVMLALPMQAMGEIDAPVERHPLELKALTEPDTVLAQLPGAIVESQAAGQTRQVLLLNLAKANACRVVADWHCQRDAGAEAALVAEKIGEPLLQVRGLIAESRGRASMQDYSRAEQLLAKAESILRATPSSELSADVMLAYSSISSVIGKHEIAISYAERGLALLKGDHAMPMQARLLRNLAFSNGLLQRVGLARDAVERGLRLADRIGDPKLSAELHIESARLARISGDLATADRDARAVLALSEQLRNTQLAGLAFELLGLNAMDARDWAGALEQLALALKSFQQLGLQRDELRVSRAILTASLDSGVRIEELEEVLRRFLVLLNRINDRDRAQAADDFEARVRYAEQRLEMVRLESEAEVARAGTEQLRAEAKVNRTLIALSLMIVAALAMFFLLQRRANRRLRASIELRSRALTQTSHELRNPIAGIIGLTELLANTHLSPQQSQMIKAIRGAGGTLGNLAQDLLDRGRIEAGRLSLAFEPSSVISIAQSLHELHLPIARGKGLELKLFLSDDLPPQISIDPHRLQQVLANLIGNSLKFTSSGVVTLAVRRLNPAPDGRVRIIFSVSDTGPGMAADELQTLFEPFAKGAAGHRHRSGAGLGLAISNDLVTLMGGKLTVTSEPGRGTEFSFRLDAAIVESPPGPVSAPSAVGLGVSALVVDDDDDCALVVSSHLSMLGCKVDVAGSSEGAMQRVNDANYDLIMIDVELPDGHGPDLVALLRALGERTLNARIAILSAHQPPTRLPAGVDLWLTKPAQIERLAALVADVKR